MNCRHLHPVQVHFFSDFDQIHNYFKLLANNFWKLYVLKMKEKFKRSKKDNPV